MTAAAANLVFTAQGERTVVERAYAQSPMKLLTPRNHGRGAWAYVSSFGGGFVDGDSLNIDARVNSKACALLSTQGASRVYRSRVGATSSVSAQVAAGGVLMVLPDPVVCFQDARFRQTQTFSVAAGGSLIVLEWLSAGRLAYGERWAFEEYDNQLVVELEGNTIWRDRVLLTRRHGSIAARMRHFNAIATLAIVGTELQQQAELIASNIQALELTPNSRFVASAARVGAKAHVFKFASTELETMTEQIRAHLAFVPEILGDNPFARRF
jgi:urease accessory protein